MSIKSVTIIVLLFSVVSGSLQEFDQHRLSGPCCQELCQLRVDGRGRLLQPFHPVPFNGFAHTGPGRFFNNGSDPSPPGLLEELTPPPHFSQNLASA